MIVKTHQIAQFTRATPGSSLVFAIKLHLFPIDSVLFIDILMLANHANCFVLALQFLPSH